MVAPQLIAAVASAVMMTGFAANEMSHGAFAESMGMGHHHMADNGGYHCARPDDPEWQQHEAHMHGEGMQDHCGSGHMGMADGHQGMGSMGAMSPMEGPK